MKTKSIAFALAVVVSGLTGGVAVAQVTHQNGLGQTYVSMFPLGTYNQAAATQAALAWATAKGGNAGGINAGQCPFPANTSLVYTQIGAACGAWVYTGTLRGRALQSADCSCPTASSPTWN